MSNNIYYDMITQVVPSDGLTQKIRNEMISVAEARAFSPRKMQRKPILRPLLITAAVLIVVTATTALAFGDEISQLFMVTPIEQTPVIGYINVDDNSELMPVLHEFDGERGTLEFYVSTYNLEVNNGKYSLREVVLGNARMILLRPNDSNGFFLKEGDAIYLYALLDLTPKHADESGRMVQIGYSLDNVLHETYSGNLTSGGMIFEITAPTDGEFVIFVINTSLDLQNYKELTVMLNKE